LPWSFSQAAVLLKLPISSFFFVSTEMTGCYMAISQRTVAELGTDAVSQGTDRRGMFRRPAIAASAEKTEATIDFVAAAMRRGTKKAAPAGCLSS
jgi:hypothetical protein